LNFDILTLFPETFDSPLKASILGRAAGSGLIQTRLHQLRDWADDRHRVVDDAPYGGGGGMVMKPDVVVRAVRAVRDSIGNPPGTEVPVVYLSPQGELLNARIVDDLAALPGLILLCGSYEGVDERAIEAVVDREISIGDYVLTGGELPALVLINAIARKLEGVLGNAASAPNDSFENGLLDFPHYTRPELFEGRRVPEILLGGHHANIEQWRRRQSLLRTARRRPDLLARAPISDEERRWLESYVADPGSADGDA
jgi:tRNA (guanine37-N1)-methyltransferase